MITTIAGVELREKDIEALVEMAIEFYGSAETLLDAVAWHILDKAKKEHAPK